MLIANTLKAAKNLGYTQIAVAGGVSANSELRQRLTAECEKLGYSLYYPPLKYCGDNAAMVGVQAYFEFADGNVGDSSLNATATLPIDYR
jgi:N6-L-threonylcarbamoyladenine synthase